MSPTLTLGIDTSTDVRVGLADGAGVLASRAVTDSRAHAEQLMPLVNATLAEAGRTLHDLGLIVVGVGPGPFTGLRVGVVTAQTLGFALGVPVRGVCSLDAVAAGHLVAGNPGGEFLAVSDARRREVYWARYDTDGRRVEGPAVSPASELPELPVVGPGAGLAGGTPSPLDGGVLALAGPELPEVGLSPLYLRRPDATVPTNRKSTLLQPRLARGLARS
ncbi:tRNA (adenosine(37)-N6)-threonylcarbamoyltransferase complex dimerization subunit type 1 TsaB [Micropruina sp.]|uniref:tRNA (adenosine(37)-N6)-threonylcarbamoyltransferase complex dimerization subunit type 1 TsaB n=1 Tax=Micropruina sp. TaxID=2737536 RepID=UPI002633B849|nr:tRNA (adenosine(37)-N6)-threonylcarbamoyltransferase complex dimerization subunit type 1 TsaB [Micropruina sp.]